MFGNQNKKNFFGQNLKKYSDFVSGNHFRGDISDILEMIGPEYDEKETSYKITEDFIKNPDKYKINYEPENRHFIKLINHNDYEDDDSESGSNDYIDYSMINYFEESQDEAYGGDHVRDSEKQRDLIDFRPSHLDGISRLIEKWNIRNYKNYLRNRIGPKPNKNAGILFSQSAGEESNNPDDSFGIIKNNGVSPNAGEEAWLKYLGKTKEEFDKWNEWNGLANWDEIVNTIPPGFSDFLNEQNEDEDDGEDEYRDWEFLDMETPEPDKKDGFVDGEKYHYPEDPNSTTTDNNDADEDYDKFTQDLFEFLSNKGDGSKEKSNNPPAPMKDPMPLPGGGIIDNYKVPEKEKIMDLIENFIGKIPTNAINPNDMMCFDYAVIVNSNAFKEYAKQNGVNITSSEIRGYKPGAYSAFFKTDKTSNFDHFGVVMKTSDENGKSKTWYTDYSTFGGLKDLQQIDYNEKPSFDMSKRFGENKYETPEEQAKGSNSNSELVNWLWEQWNSDNYKKIKAIEKKKEEERRKGKKYTY